MSSIDPKTGSGEIKSGSDRSFGLVFTVVFLAVGLWPLLLRGDTPRWLFVAIAVILGLVSLLRPGVLAPLNKLWFKLGILLSKVVNPLVMSIIFVVTVIPTGLIMRMLGKRPLQLKVDSGESMWRKVDSEDSSGSFRNQF